MVSLCGEDGVLLLEVHNLSLQMVEPRQSGYVGSQRASWDVGGKVDVAAFYIGMGFGTATKAA
jgi:hypothetical protein